MRDPQAFKFRSVPWLFGLIGASRKVVHESHVQQHACAQSVKNRDLTPTYADVTLILMPSVMLSLLQSCMCICCDSILRAPNACTAFHNLSQSKCNLTVAYVPTANLAYQCRFEWQCSSSHKYTSTTHVTWSSSCPCCSSGAVVLAAKLARMQLRSASGLKTPALGTCATTQTDSNVPADQVGDSKSMSLSARQVQALCCTSNMLGRSSSTRSWRLTAATPSM